MVRTRFHYVPALGRFNEAMQWVKDLNDACRKAGCAEGKVWDEIFGKVNFCVIEYEYADLAAYERDLLKFQSSADVMKVFRRGTEVRAPEHWPWLEVLREAPTLA